ncbi:MAG: sel1 repeat family protein [Magnetococcales bacterium]|nr:sel1 repeat family protein [Magnetococcales bacterium]
MYMRSSNLYSNAAISASTCQTISGWNKWNDPSALKLGWGMVAVLFVLLFLVVFRVSTRSDYASLQLITRMAQEGNSDAQLQLGLAYRAGRYGLKQDDKAALHWLERSAEELSYAAVLVGDYYAQGQGSEPNPSLARFWWHKAAMAGDAKGWERLGMKPPVSLLRAFWNSLVHDLTMVFRPKYS